MTTDDDKFRRWYRRLVIAIFVALAAVLIAIAAGVGRHRLWPVAGFLMLAAGGAAYNHVARRARKRRMHRLRQSPLPIGIRQRKPFWIRLDESTVVLDVAGLIGAIVAAVGFPQAALGVVIVLATLMGAGQAMFTMDLTIENGGLRFHFGAAHILVPWPSIRTVRSLGEDNFQLIRLGVADLDRLRDTVSPDTPRNRKRMRNAFSISGDEILLMPWTAGLDGQTLERAIREGQAGTADRLN